MNPFAPCHTITVDTGAFSTDGSASILDAALAQGAQVPFSCQRGECGSCRATVLEGRYERIAPANERSYVTADDELLMCQCRAAGDLRLTFPHWQAPARRPSRAARAWCRACRWRQA
ncbi:2Fe-2S iron-sulfur cluster-binding protein [Achromobacter xylosoxidans]